MPTTADPAEPTKPAKAMTSAERDALLAANRQARDELRAKEAEKAAAKGGETKSSEAQGDDADGDDADVDAAPAEPTASMTVAARPSRTAFFAVSALAAALAIATGIFAFLYATSDSGLGPESGIGRAAIDDGRTYAEQIVTYSAGDYSALDKQIRAISTPEFADRYIASSQEARKGNDAAGATSTGTAQSAGLVSITNSKAEVLVALDQKVTSPQLPAAGAEGLQYQRRVLLTLVREGDRWVVSDLAQT